MTSPRPRRTASAVLAVLAGTALLAGTAGASWAAPSPAQDPASAATPSGGPTVLVQDGTVTVTLDTAHVEQMCAEVPQAQQRITALVTRIQAGSDVPGSAAAVSARAAAARADGQESVAARLDLRAQLRLSRVAELQQVSARLTTAQETVCAPLAAQLGSGS